MYASKHQLTHAFAFAAAAQAARVRPLRRAERTRLVSRRPAFRRAARPAFLRLHGDSAAFAFRAAFDAHRLRTWYDQRLERLRADAATTRRLCGKRILPP